MKILDKQALLEKKIREGFTLKSRAFVGSPEKNLSSTNPEDLEVKQRSMSITLSSPQWEGSKGHADTWEKIEEIYRKGKKNMAAMLPDDWNVFSDMMRVDVTRRYAAEADYTSLVESEQVNPAFTKTVALDEFLPWAAAFETVYGNNDEFPLMEHKTGSTGSVAMEVFGVSDKSSLQEQIFSSFYDLERRNQAVARGYAAIRNNRNVLGRMVAKTTAGTWNANQQVPADATAGASKEELLYNTYVAGLKKLYSLVDPQTKLPIDTPEVFAVIPKDSEFAHMRALDGQLNVGKSRTGNFESLFTRITQVIPFRGDKIYMGNKTYDYPGVSSSKAYLFVPKVANYTMVKRGLTVETGDRYDEKTNFYGIQTEYHKEFFGGSDGLTAGSGYCVEITLPTL